MSHTFDLHLPTELSTHVSYAQSHPQMARDSHRDTVKRPAGKKCPELGRNSPRLPRMMVGVTDLATQQRISFEPFISRGKWSAFRNPWDILRREHISK